MENTDYKKELKTIAKETKKFKDTSEGIAEKASKLTDVLTTVKEKAKAISNTTSEIKSISDTTNILSVNASIEAARAGEAGKGFSVVAQEMYTLANTTKGASEQVFVLLKELIRKVDLISEELVGLHALHSEQGQIIETIMASVSAMSEQDTTQENSEE